MKTKVTFHPKFAAGVDLLFGGVFVWWISNIGNWWSLLLWVVFRLFLWALLIKFSFYPTRINRIRHWFTLALFMAGMLAYLLFVEWIWAWGAVAIIFAAFPAMSFWLLPPKEADLDFTFKPFRRWNLSLVLLGLAGAWSALTAIPIYQLFYLIGDWVWGMVGAILSGVVAFWWWQEYGIERQKNVYIWAAIFTAIIWQACWVFTALPLGPLVLGLIMVWLWYVLWLLARFHLSSGGLNWPKQKWFLIINAVLFLIVTIFLVRWK